MMKNLTCPTCANKIEERLVKLPFIEKATFNFVNETMLLEVNEHYQENTHISDIRRVVERIESGVSVFLYEQRHTKIKVGFFRKNWLIFLGVALFLLGELLAHYFDLVRINPLYWSGYFLIAHKILIATLKGLKNKQFFNENVLMLIATMAAMSIGKPHEAILVILFYTLGEHLQHRAVEKSKKEINALMDLHIEYAYVYDNNEWVIKDPMSIKKNDLILVKNGEKIPVDGIIAKGKSSLNTSALTGESALKSVQEGMFVLSGNINVGSVLEIKAAKEYQDSTISKIIDLIENAPTNRSKTELFITRFAKFYTPIVTVMALLIFAIPSYFNPSMIEEYIHRAAIFLVISCPCALVLSIPLSYFAGIGSSARKGILFKGSNYLDMMQEVELIGLDKTGTLTKGNFVVENYTNEAVLKIAASVERFSNHPIAKSLVAAHQGDYIHYDSVEEIAGLGMKATYQGNTILVGNRKLLQKEKISIKDKKDLAGTNIFVAQNKNYLGFIIIKDQLKANTRTTINSLRKKHRLVMLTGDNEATAKDISKELGDLEYIPNLLPNQKVEHFEALKTKGVKMYVGDGINDAPLLKLADISVAMGKGSELALDVADIIITDDDLNTLNTAFSLAKYTREVVYQNIILSLGVKFSFLVLAGLGHTSMLAAIFADVGVTMLAVLNALRLIYGKRVKRL